MRRGVLVLLLMVVLLPLVAGQETEIMLCSSCGEGALNSCDGEECFGFNEGCYFVDNSWPIPDTCHACSGVLSCEDYQNDENNCFIDTCGIGNCEWDSEVGSCFDYVEEIPEAFVKVLVTSGGSTVSGAKVDVLFSNNDEADLGVTGGDGLSDDGLVPEGLVLEGGALQFYVDVTLGGSTEREFFTIFYEEVNLTGTNEVEFVLSGFSGLSGLYVSGEGIGFGGCDSVGEGFVSDIAFASPTDSSEIFHCVKREGFSEGTQFLTDSYLVVDGVCGDRNGDGLEDAGVSFNAYKDRDAYDSGTTVYSLVRLCMTGAQGGSTERFVVNSVFSADEVCSDGEATGSFIDEDGLEWTHCVQFEGEADEGTDVEIVSCVDSDSTPKGLVFPDDSSFFEVGSVDLLNADGDIVDSVEDECSAGGDAVVESYCDALGDVGTHRVNCANGCLNGRCILDAEVCVDTDSDEIGEVNIGIEHLNEAGIAYNGDERIKDECDGDFNVREAYCAEGEVDGTFVPMLNPSRRCDDGFSCKVDPETGAAACVSEEVVCEDTDPENDLAVMGTCTDFMGNEFADQCGARGVLQYSCSDEGICVVDRAEKCDDGEMCSEGACGEEERNSNLPTSCVRETYSPNGKNGNTLCQEAFADDWACNPGDPPSCVGFFGQIENAGSCLFSQPRCDQEFRTTDLAVTCCLAESVGDAPASGGFLDDLGPILPILAIGAFMAFGGGGMMGGLGGIQTILPIAMQLLGGMGGGAGGGLGGLEALLPLLGGFLG